MYYIYIYILSVYIIVIFSTRKRLNYTYTLGLAIRMEKKAMSERRRSEIRMMIIGGLFPKVRAIVIVYSKFSSELPFENFQVHQTNKFSWQTE